jgi:hypothetical protein
VGAALAYSGGGMVVGALRLYELYDSSGECFERGYGWQVGARLRLPKLHNGRPWQMVRWRQGKGGARRQDVDNWTLACLCQLVTGWLLIVALYKSWGRGWSRQDCRIGLDYSAAGWQTCLRLYSR